MGLCMRERNVNLLIRERANWVIGGYENSVSDGIIEEMPPVEKMEKEIYNEVMSTNHIQIKAGLLEIKKDIRFLGKEKIVRTIHIMTELILQGVEL